MKKVDLIQLIIIGGIICNISETTCCKYIQQYILSKNTDANDRLKRGLTCLIPYKENYITYNSNESSQEKILIDNAKTTNNKLNTSKRDQPLKIDLHFNNTLGKNISDNVEILDRKNNTSYINMKFISDQKKIDKNPINTKNMSKNEKNSINKNRAIITVDLKANRSRRMSQKKYMCYCKQANCKGKQCLHEQIQHHYPWNKNYFPNVNEYTEDEYDEVISTENNDNPNISAYKSMKTYLKNNTPTPIEPTKFNIPFANNINFDQRVMLGNDNPLMNHQQNCHKVFQVAKYDLHNVPHNKMTYSEVTPIQQNYTTVTDSQLKETNNFIPSVFDKNLPNIDDCIKFYGHTVCIISRKIPTDNIQTIDLLNILPIKSYLNQNNELDEYYTNTKTEYKFSHSNKFGEIIKSNSNITFNKYLTKEIIKNINNKNNIQNIKQTNTYQMNKNNPESLQNANLNDSLRIINITNSSNNISKPIFFKKNFHSQIPLQSNNTQRQINTQFPELMPLNAIQNTVDDVAIVTNNSTFIKQNKQNSSEKQMQIKFSNNIQNLHNNQNEEFINNFKNRSEMPQIRFSINDTKTSLKEIEQDNLITDISNLLKKNNSKNYERNMLMKLNINPDIINIKTTQKPLYGQTRRSTTEYNKKLIQLENKLNFPDINMIDLNQNKKFKNIEYLVQPVDQKPYLMYENTSKDNFMKYSSNNDIIRNSNVSSFSSNFVNQTYKNINDNIMLTLNSNRKTKINDNFNNSQVNIDIETQDNVNEILFKNVIKKIINNFVPGKAQDLITNYRTDNNLKFSSTNMEDIFPEILNTPILRNLFFNPEVEDMIADTAKNFIFQITGSSLNNIQILKNMLHNIVDKIFVTDSTVSSVTINKDRQSVTETVTLLEKSKNLVTSTNLPKKIFNKIENIINQAAIGEKNARKPVIKNLIIKTVKYSLGKEIGGIDESTIRHAFELLFHKNIANSSNFTTSRKTSITKTNNSLTFLPENITTLNNTDYNVEYTNSNKNVLQNRQLIESQKNLVKKQDDENVEIKEKRKISQEKLNKIRFRKIKPESQFVNYTIQKAQIYPFNSQNVKEDSEKLGVLSEKPVNYTFSNEKLKNKYIGEIELSESDALIKRKPIKYFTPNDRILEYIKNHQSLDNLNLKAIAEIIGHESEHNIDKVTRQVFNKNSKVRINNNTSKIYKHPINILDNELLKLKSTPYELDNITEKEHFKPQPINTNSYKKEQPFQKIPITLSINNHQSNILIGTNSSLKSKSGMLKNNVSKPNIKIGNNIDKNQTINELNHNQILNVSRNKLSQSLSLNKYIVNSSLSQNFNYFRKLMPENYHQMPEIKNSNQLQESKLLYIGDDVKLLIIIKKLGDGTFALMLSDDICKQCIYKNCSCYLPNTNEQVFNVRERRSDETIPLFNFIGKQENVKESAIHWLTETLAKANNLIPNLTINDKSIIKNQTLKDTNEKSNRKSNMNQSQRDFSVIIDPIATESKELHKTNEFINKQINPNNILNKKIAKTFTSILEKQLNNNAISTEKNTQIINNCFTQNNIEKNQLDNDNPQKKLENDINQIKQNNKIDQKLNKIKFQNIRNEKKSNINNVFNTKFDSEMRKLFYNELRRQTQNNKNSVNGGPPYKYQRYANEDVIVSKRTKTLNNVLYFMKDLIINTTDEH